MALAETLAVADFVDLFKVQDIEFAQNFMQQSSVSGGGERRSADRAAALFKAKVQTQSLKNADAIGIMALINSRGGGLKTFLAYDYRLPYPGSDPNGTILGATVPKLGTITDRLTVAFTGFPNSYVIPRGTYFSIIFDTSRYYLGQFGETKTAHASTGAVSATSIWPPLPAMISGTPDILFKKAPAKFKMVANSAFASKSSGLHSTIEFSAEQTYGK